MITKREEKKLFIADLVCLILSAISLVFFTWLFGVTESNFRYMFIMFILYAFYNFVFSGREVELYLKMRKIKKNSSSKINLTSFENVSIL